MNKSPLNTKVGRNPVPVVICGALQICLHINWYRISSINSMSLTFKMLTSWNVTSEQSIINNKICCLKFEVLLAMNVSFSLPLFLKYAQLGSWHLQEIPRNCWKSRFRPRAKTTSSGKRSNASKTPGGPNYDPRQNGVKMAPGRSDRSTENVSTENRCTVPNWRRWLYNRFFWACTTHMLDLSVFGWTQTQSTLKGSMTRDQP